MSRERKLPAVPAISSKVPREIAQVLGPLKQIVEALQQGGVVAASSNGIGGAGSASPSTNIPDDVLDKLLDVTIPPAPTGVMVHGGMALIIVEFDRPAYRNHAYTELWRADSDDFSKAVLIGTTQAFVYSDSVGGGRVAWYWLRHVSSSTPPRFGPFNSQTGTRGETGQDATYVLDLVKGKLQDVHIAQVNAAKVVGTLQDWQLEAINANKIAGQLLDSQLAALNAAKLVGQLQDQQIAQLSVDKLLGKVQFSQLASDVQGPLNSAIYTANQALVKANEAATATSVTQLQARVDAMSTNLLPVDLWKPNGQPLPAPWRNNVNAGIEQTLVSLPGPYGDATTVLKAVAAGGHNDGGWDVDVKIDITKAYRFSVWIKDVSGSAGSAYLGIQGVQQGGVDAPNPYFLVVPKTALTDGVWHLFVGYVYPAGSVHPANAHSAVYEGTTGNVVFLGNDYTWSPQAEWVSPRCYQYYANEGAEQWFAYPRFEVIDGREPSIFELLSGAGLSVARTAITRVSNVEAALPGKANASDVTSLQARVSDTESNVSSALSRVSAVETALPGKAAASDVTNLYAKLNRRRTYALRASGNAYDGRYGYNQGLFSIDGDQTAVVSGYNRSYTVVRFSANGNVASAVPFDVYGNGEVYGNGGSAEMANYLNTIPNGELVLVYTSDEPYNNRLANGLDLALYRCGASSAVFGSQHFKHHSVYALFGKAGGGPGSGQEFYKGAIAQDPAAFFSLSFEVIKNEFVGVSPGPGTQASAALDRVSQVEAVLPGKASATDVTNLQGRVTNAESNVTAALGRVGSVEAALPGKASVSDVTNLQGRVSNAESNVSSALNRVGAVEAALPGKATASDVATLTARVGNAESSISTISQAVATVDGRVSGRYGIAITATLPDGRKKLSGLQAFNDGSVSQFVITADQLLIQPSGSIINLDPNFTDASHWIVDPGPNANPEFAYVTSAAGAVASTCLYARNASGTGTADVWLRSREVFPINPDKVYRLSGRFYSDSGNGRTAYLAILLFDSLGNMLLPGWGGSWSGYPWYGAPSEGSFTEYAGNFGPGTGRSIPSNATQARVGVILNYGAGGENRRMAVQDLRLEEVIPGTLIRPGEITTTHLVAQAVTAEKLAAYSVDVQHLRAGVVTTDKLAAGAVTAVSIKAGEIQTSHFAPLSVTTEKLAAESITAAKLAAQSVTADKLVAQSVTAEKISAGAVTADKLSVGSLSAISANIGTVTAGTLRNAAGSAFVDLNASGSAPFISTSGGFRLNADGSGSIDSRILGNVATGQVVIGVRHYGSYDSGYFEYDTVTIVHGRGRPVLPAMWYVVGNQNMPQLVWNNEYSIGISVSGDSVGFTTVGFAYI